jgi:hypothetical protein
MDVEVTYSEGQQSFRREVRGWGSPDGFLELQQRNGIVAVHPGGTADVQRVTMARRIGIGRTSREAAGTVH